MHRSIDSIEFGVCNSDHPPASREATLLNMDTTTHISTVEKDSHDGIIVTFSDGTAAGYVVEELLMLRPHREQAHRASKPVQRTTIATVGNSISAQA